MNKTTIIFVAFLILSAAAVVIALNINTSNQPDTNQTQEGQVRESEVGAGVEELPAEEPPSATAIILTTPQEEETISSPVEIRGQARGSWFFEATFPVILTNWDGLIIAEGYATAEGDWMTENFVPFTAELEFEPQPVSNRGSLILQKANPSGLPENDEALEITVYLGN